VLDQEAEIQEIEEAKSDPRKFEPLYKRYYEQILRFTYKRVEDIDDCRELTAIVFANAISNIKAYKHLGFPFSSWLYRIAINEINRYYKKRNKARIISVNEKSLNNIAEDSGEKAKELEAVLKKALMYLDPEELILIELRYFEERSFAELGEILEISEGNAKIRTYRVIDKLKSIYNKL
jgi:RNA polymerase sigma-70 factor (ECF subfamily)